MQGLGDRHAIYVDSPVYRNAAYDQIHPLGIERTVATSTLCQQLDWLPNGIVRESAAASINQLRDYHDEQYIDALLASDASGKVTRAHRERYNIGTMENPLFKGLFARAATTVGGSILAARLALEGRVVFHPAGGTHHAQRDRASGFCYFNDPVFAINVLHDAGLERILYVDLDAHHGDGVEAAFRDNPRVALLSIHEENRWPYSGNDDDVVNPRICNIPVPAYCSDHEYEYLLHKLAYPFAVACNPQAVVITCGADALAGDPLSHMNLSNVCLWDAVEAFSKLAARIVVLGGGGYNPWTVARCWSGLWARLAQLDIATKLPSSVIQTLAGLECILVDDEDIESHWLTSIADQASHEDAIRAEVRALAEQKATTLGTSN